MTAPNQAWVTDITYIATDQGWRYLAGVKDLFNGELCGYAMSERMTKELVMQALFRTVAAKWPGGGWYTIRIVVASIAPTIIRRCSGNLACSHP